MTDVGLFDSESITWDRIPCVMNKYSWAAKMQACWAYCLKSMWQGRQWCCGDLSKVPTPWELNMFAALAAIYADGPVKLMPRSTFIAIINCMRNGLPQTPIKTLDQIKRFLCRTAIIQFQYQQESMLLFLRYRYLYLVVDCSHNLDMPAIFRRTFGVDVEDVLCLQLLIYLASASGADWVSFVRHFCQEYSLLPAIRLETVIELFSIRRDVYAKKQAALNAFSTDGVANAINLMEQYPFLQMGDGYFLPLPYLLNVAAGRHLFDRMMTANKNLRSKVGHWAMEPYVYDLFVRSRCYESVNREVRYKVGKQDRDSPDIFVRTLGETIFVEVKLIEAPLELRQGFDTEISFYREKTAKHLFQIYSRIREIQNNYAAPKLVVQKDRVWGVVVVHEDAYLVRDDIYQYCFDRHPEMTAEDKIFVKKRIAIASLYEIENFCCRHRSLLPALQARTIGETAWSNMALDTDTLKDAPLDFQMDGVIKELARQLPARLFRPAV